MKTQKLSFLKLLCFKYKFNLLYLDVICILVAIVFSCILLQYAVVAPSEDIIQICESTLCEYFENPTNYIPQKNVSIILRNDNIIATIPQAFTYSIATRTENQTYQIDTHIKFFYFIMAYCIRFLFNVILLYFTIEVSLYILINWMKSFLAKLEGIKDFTLKKFQKAINEFERKQKQKGLKEYEIPRLKEIYQIGYNMGHADGIAEGAKMGKSDLQYQN